MCLYVANITNSSCKFNIKLDCDIRLCIVPGYSSSQPHLRSEDPSYPRDDPIYPRDDPIYPRSYPQHRSTDGVDRAGYDPYGTLPADRQHKGERRGTYGGVRG